MTARCPRRPRDRGPNRTRAARSSSGSSTRESEPFCWLTCPLRWTGARNENDLSQYQPRVRFIAIAALPAVKALEGQDSQAEHEQRAATRWRPADLRVRQRSMEIGTQQLELERRLNEIQWRRQYIMPRGATRSRIR